MSGHDIKIFKLTLCLALIICVLIGCFHTDQTEKLIKELKSKDACTRIKAAKALGNTASNRPVTSLIEALNDQDARVRAEAAKSLGKLWDSILVILQDKRIIAPLIRALKDKAPPVRAEAAKSLGKIKDTSTIPHLIKALTDSNPYVRKNTSTALRRIGKPAIKFLEVTVNNNNDILLQKEARNLLAIIQTDVDLRNKKVRQVADNYAHYIVHGIYEDFLIEALMKYGNKKMAEDFLICGNLNLEAAANMWAKAHGYEIYTKSFPVEQTPISPRWNSRR